MNNDTRNNTAAIQSARQLERQLHRTADAYLQVGRDPATAEEISKKLVSAYRGGIGR